VTFKEVRLSPKIGSGDFDTKVHRAIEFLEDGDRIKVTVRFRGRELTHPELGRNMLTRFTERIKEHGVAERAPLLEGKSMHLTVASLHKPKEHEVPVKPGRTAESGTAEKAAPSPAPARPAATTNGAEQPAAVAATAAAATAAPTAAAAAATPAEPTATPAEKPAERATAKASAAADAPAASTKKTESPAPQAPAATGE
jgi:hypothetical protein